VSRRIRSGRRAKLRYDSTQRPLVVRDCRSLFLVLSVCFLVSGHVGADALVVASSFLCFSSAARIRACILTLARRSLLSCASPRSCRRTSPSYGQNRLAGKAGSCL
jgi:hypothetical protein